jgi:hypothetical protein
MPTLIFCAGGTPQTACIAQAAGMRLGARLPETVYGELYFADQDWHAPDRAAYMAALARHRPVAATVLDLERPEQLGEVLSWAEEAAQLVREAVVVIPKFRGAIAQLPRQIGGKRMVLGLSVPTGFGGIPHDLDLTEFAGWRVHLLGGSPHLQIAYWCALSGTPPPEWLSRNARRLAQRYAPFGALAEVVSADGNMAQDQAGSCRFWSPWRGPKGHWWQLAQAGDTDRARGARARALERSCATIVATWQALARGGTVAELLAAGVEPPVLAAQAHRPRREPQRHRGGHDRHAAAWIAQDNWQQPMLLT